MKLRPFCTTRRSVLKAAVSTFLATGFQSAGIDGATGEKWYDLVGGSEYEVVKKELIRIGSCDVEGDTAKVMLRNLLQTRCFHEGSRVTEKFQVNDLKAIQELRKIDKELLVKSFRDSDFQRAIQPGELLGISPEDAIKEWNDIRGLHGLSENALQSEFSKRNIRATQANFSWMIKSIVHITNGARGYNITCLVSNIEKARNAVEGVLGKELPQGVYDTLSFNGVGQTAVGGGRITEIQLISKTKEGNTASYETTEEYIFGEDKPKRRISMKFRENGES